MSLVKNNPFNFSAPVVKPPSTFSGVSTPMTGQAGYSNQPSGQYPGITQYGQAALGGAQLAGQLIGHGQGRTINSEAPTQERDAYGRPAYNLGSYAVDVNNFKPQGASGGQVLSAAGQGALAGAAFGLPGAAIGAVAGAIGSIGAGLFGKSAEQDELERAQGVLRGSQMAYSNSMKNYNQNFLGRQQYEDQLKQYNLPTSYV